MTFEEDEAERDCQERFEDEKERILREAHDVINAIDEDAPDQQKFDSHYNRLIDLIDRLDEVIQQYNGTWIEKPDGPY